MEKKIIEAFSLALSGNHLALLDIGARGDLKWPWSEIPRDLLKIFLVEPDPIEAGRLDRQNSNSEQAVQVLPFALWKSNDQVTLNLNRSRATSSVLKPNKDFLDLFPESERFDPVKELSVAAVSVEYLVGNGALQSVDFAKLDIQGAELNVLKGGRDWFRSNLIGLEVEVEFAEVYKGQHLFHHVDEFVREELGLALWDLRGNYWRYKTSANIAGSKKGQLIFGDALYLRPLSNLIDFLEQFDRSTARAKLICLIFTSVAYGYYDYASTILSGEKSREIIGEDFIDVIQASISTRNKKHKLPALNSLKGKLYRVFGLLAGASRAAHNGWAISQENLGSRKIGPFWWF